MTKFYVDSNGRYLGGYDGANPPKGAKEVFSPPDDARQLWDFTTDAWKKLQKPYDERRRELFEEKEKEGELPGSVHDNIDEMWKALDALSAGDNISFRAVDIIRVRNKIKARFPKG